MKNKLIEMSCNFQVGTTTCSYCAGFGFRGSNYLADEPTGNLDEETAKDIIAILKRMALDRQKCVIVVTHSKEVAQASDVVLELKKKQLIEKKK